MERPPCPKCGGRLDFTRRYIGTESRGIQALDRQRPIATGPDARGPDTWRVTVDDEVASDEYDEILEERVYCLDDACGFAVSGDKLEVE
jgi:hypothetical protein